MYFFSVYRDWKWLYHAVLFSVLSAVGCWWPFLSACRRPKSASFWMWQVSSSFWAVLMRPCSSRMKPRTSYGPQSCSCPFLNSIRIRTCPIKTKSDASCVGLTSFKKTDCKVWKPTLRPLSATILSCVTVSIWSSPDTPARKFAKFSKNPLSAPINAKFSALTF